MRIDYLINGLNGGGAAFPMIDVIGLMRDCGHQVRVIALMAQDGRAVPRLQRAGIPYEIIGRGAWDYVGQARQLLARLRSDRPDVLWTSLTRGTVYGQIAGRLFGIPVVSWLHSAFLKPGNRAILRRTRDLTQRWVTDSESVRRYAETELGVATEKIAIWPLFVAKSAVPLAMAWNGTGYFRVGSLGRLHFSKHYDTLIRAAARVRELDPEASGRLEFVIAGDGPEAQGLAELAASLGVDNVRFLGFLDQPAEFLAGLHAYIQPSRKEGLCIAAHEAMQAALPVVATRVGELAYSVLPGETGELCRVGDVDALAQAVLALMRDPQRAAQMGQAGRERVLSRFSADRFLASGQGMLDRVERELSTSH